jgi:hypothetical protein
MTQGIQPRRLPLEVLRSYSNPEEALLRATENIGVVEFRKENRINVPDLFRDFVLQRASNVAGACGRLRRAESDMLSLHQSNVFNGLNTRSQIGAKSRTFLVSGTSAFASAM